MEKLVASCYELANQAAGMPVPAATAAGAGVATALAYRIVTLVIAQSAPSTTSRHGGRSVEPLAAGGHPGAEPDPSPPGDLSPVAPP